MRRIVLCLLLAMAGFGAAAFTYGGTIHASMEKLLDNVSDEMLQEMIECYELEFPEPLDFKNRDTRRVICYSFILRLYTLRLDDCIAESNALFEILDSCLNYVLL